MKYDSTEDTKKHIERVQRLLLDCIASLTTRSECHDSSKLIEPEKSAFDEFTPLLKQSVYGSEEYNKTMSKMRPAIEHHYRMHSHHPEHFVMWKCPICSTVFKDGDTRPSECFESKPRFCPKCCPNGSLFEATLESYIGLDGMSLLDLVEMLCDWKAAGERHATGSIWKSLQVNKCRFNIDPQLLQILENTVREMGWEAKPV